MATTRSEDRRLIEELRDKERLLDEAERVARVGGWSWDAVTDTVLWSRGYRLINGYDPDLAPPGYEEHLKAYTPESAARLDAVVQEAMKNGTPYELDLELVRPDGAHLAVVACGEATFDSNGIVVGLHGTLLDITQRKHAEESLRRSNARLERLTGEVTQAMGRIVEVRDPYTQGHQTRVAALARLIAIDMGVPDDVADSVEMAGLVHDVGKLYVPA